MQLKTPKNRMRLLVMGAIYLTVSLIYIARLLYLQVSGQDYYSMSTPAVTYTRTEKIQAQRGDICDRNGVVLVTNNYSYIISLDYDSKPDTNDKLNGLLLDLRTVAARSDETECLSEPKNSLDVHISDSGLTFFKPEGFADTARGRRYAKLVSWLNVSEDADISEETTALLYYFGITSREYVKETESYNYWYNYPYDTAAKLFLIRLDMEISGFSPVQPYELASGVSTVLISGLEELYPRGLLVSRSAERVYNYPGYLSHILGRVSKIPSDKVDYYTELGYPMDAIVGRDGAEAAFENYLHGTDGEVTITEDAYGNVLSAEITKEPVAGCDVWLTVDIKLQIVAENALAEDIFRIRAEANPNKALTGEDASAGALNVLDVNTGDVMAIASYPTFNLATFNEDFANLNSDPLSPMFNRALNGTYAPGSTFKVGVAVAALSEGTITKDTIIDTKGEYTYYADSGYYPRCWIYLLTGQVHGPINVVEAIQESCNYFFFDVGRRLTIEKMNEYCKHYGLGQPTGIELPESTGILAGPSYREDHGMGQWGPGDTLQAAIGQSDNLFTPLQISCYLSTVINSGTRYAAHMLYEVHEYGSAEPVFKTKTEILDRITISDDILNTVREGMKGVMDNGSAASVFCDYEIAVGGKTGTAQVYSNKSDNGIMTAFAPFDNPEIVVTCVIEQGSGGTESGYAIKDIFDYYFGIGKYAPEVPDDSVDNGYTDEDFEYFYDYDGGYYEDWSEDWYYDPGY